MVFKPLLEHSLSEASAGFDFPHKPYRSASTPETTMAFTPPLHSSVALRSSFPIPSTKTIFSGRIRTPISILPRPPPYLSTPVLSRRRNTSHTVASSKKSKVARGLSWVRGIKQKPRQNDAMEEDVDEDAFETLFRQIEEDLENDDLSTNDSDEEINDDDLVRLTQELDEALRDDELMAGPNSIQNNTESDIDGEEYDESDDEERPVTLKTWQLRRLASALKVGRRKTNIKSLSADVCLDRAVVLQLLRDPPPNLLMMSATLPDEPKPLIAAPETLPKEIIEAQRRADATKSDANAKVPVHVLRRQWFAQKRLKKVQVETLERVYQRTKRPTNTMVNSIVHVTNLRRKRVLKWFEDKRAEDGVSNRYHLPFQRPSCDIESSTHGSPL